MEASETSVPVVSADHSLTADFKESFDNIFKSEPTNATQEALVKWREVGPLTLEQIFESSTDITVDQTVKFQLSPFDTGILGQHTKPPEDSDN